MQLGCLGDAILTMISSLGVNGWWAKRNTLPMSGDWGETLRDKSGWLEMAKAREKRNTRSRAQKEQTRTHQRKATASAIEYELSTPRRYCNYNDN